MRTICCLALVLGFATIASGEDLGKKPCVEVEIAIALAKAKNRVKLELSNSLNIADAKPFAIESKRPVFINFGECDCSELCKTLRPDFITVHEKSEVSKFRLGAYDSDGAFWIIHDWEKMPSEKEVKEVWEIGRKLMNAK